LYQVVIDVVCGGDGDGGVGWGERERGVERERRGEAGRE
jgi:hypothetical protein